MDIDIGQLIWAIVILIFIVAGALKNLRKKQQGTNPIPVPEKKPKSNDELRRFLEELMGIKRHEEEPAPAPVILKEPKKKPRPKIIKEELPEVPKGRLIHLEGLKTQPAHEAPKPSEKPIAPLRNELRRAIILSEILGPPLAKRRTHRLF